MRPYIMLLALLPAFAVCPHLSAQPTLADKVGPRLEFPEAGTFSFGTTGPGKIIDTAYVINRGDDTLHIYNAKSSCGCMFGELLQKAIPPGDTAEFLEIHFDLSHRSSGPVQKSFLIYTNDYTNDTNGRFTLRVHADVVQDLEWSVDNQSYVSYLLVDSPGDTGITYLTLNVLATGDSAVTLYPIHRDEQESDIRIEIPALGKPLTIQPGEETALEIQIGLEENADPVSRDFFTIPTSSLYQPAIRLPVYIRPPGR